MIYKNVYHLLFTSMQGRQDYNTGTFFLKGYQSKYLWEYQWYIEASFHYLQGNTIYTLYRKSSIKPPLSIESPSLISPSPLSQNLK